MVSPLYNEDTIGEYTAGTVVRAKYDSSNKRIGHIVSFLINETNEVILLVNWAVHIDNYKNTGSFQSDSSVTPIHPNNVEIL